MKTRIASIIISAVTCLALFCAGATTARAATYSVFNYTDSGAGSLRERLASVANGDTINFAGSLPATITLTTGELLVTNNVTILGPGADVLAVNGNYPNTTNRVFHIGSGITVTIAGLTITNGAAIGPSSPDNRGAGILNDHSVLTVSDCTISGNSAPFFGEGGGIYNAGFNLGGFASLAIINSTLSGNSASVDGGGIANFGVSDGNSMVTIVNSTLSGNTSANGGAIYSDGRLNGTAILEIVNSTLSGNSGGGIFNDGGSIGTPGTATVQIGSTILNASGIANFSGTVTSLGYNLSSDGGGGVLNQPTDLVNTNAMLGPLQLNGGQTPTHALLCGSPAIDAGTNLTASATDQRGPGFARVVGCGIDIGAYEVQPGVCNSSPVALCANVTVPAGASCTANASVDAGSFDPDACDTITLVQSPPGPYALGVTSVTLTVTDSHGLSNFCNATVTVRAADLAISKRANLTTVRSGQNLIYTVIVTNAGPVSATGVLVNDPLHSATTFVSATTTQGSLVTPPVGFSGTVSCNLGTMAANANATITITVKVNGRGRTIITNTATVQSTGCDANLGNNSASLTTRIFGSGK